MGRKRHAVGEPGAEGAVYEQAGDPLLCALFAGDVHGARELIEAGGVNIEAADHLGWRPLHRAAFGGFDEIVGLLVAKRADPCSADADGLQPLHIAAAGGHLGVCRHLISARADPASPDGYSGMSAQMYALTQEGPSSEELQQLLGAPNFSLFAAWGDPLATARYLAEDSSTSELTEEQRQALASANEFGALQYCKPCEDRVGGAEAADASKEHKVDDEATE
eukprot:TRINITY_DN109519_c0_g1_i1.p1 TRINITY_DN109519_c0_g1~~TRINITY_DN109519_c0_g1_i1.p1  ORF type:complete len:222 (-),score=49.84 TRINITY_DN109519_c0_g1_i1:49-714(-)